MRYYLHIENSTRLFDPQGKELPDDAAALRAATALAESLGRSPVHQGEARIRVVDGSGRTVMSVAIPARR